MANEFSNDQMVVGILTMGIIIAVIIYFIFPTVQSDSVRWPKFDAFFGFNIPGQTSGDDSGNDSGDDSGNDSGATGTVDPTGQTNACQLSMPGNCQLRCQSASECPAGLGCVEGICRCQSSLGGVCRKPDDCNCRLGIKCSLPEQKCVPNNFYYDFGEAVENCPTGVRRGYFYDPYIMMMDGTRGDFQSGYRCV